MGYLRIIPILIFLFFLASPVSAAAPDGLGPWADNVVSSSQGLTADGQAVPASRSNPLAALGVPEDDHTNNASFFSLGFGGQIVLGFDNGISDGVLIVESTFPENPLEKARVEVSENGTTFMMAGIVVQDGEVSVPDGITCARFVRITDVSDPADFPQNIHSDGYDVDGTKAIGESCTSPTPAPSVSPTPAATGVPGGATTPPPPPAPAPPGPPSPGFPNTGCVATNITTIPSISQATRVSPTSISVSWGPFAGLSDFIVRYGFSSDNLQFNTKVSGFTTTISQLPPNVPIWVQVAATDNCAVGTFGGAVLVGGGGAIATGGVPGFPNTGGNRVPRLPNTGVGPQSRDIPWGIIVSAPLSLIIFYLKRRVSNDEIT